MVEILRNRFDRSPIIKDQKECETNNCKNFSKVEALYVAVICFSTYCLSSIILETGGRSSLGGALTKSAAFNALFRGVYKLKIIILIKNVIVGFISTIMIILGNKYHIPYLYLPWLVNTMKGMALNEGPTLLNLANVLLPNVTLPTGFFILTTFFLYVEELFIWNDVFAQFKHCWKDYHCRKQFAVIKHKEELLTRDKRILCQADANRELNTAVAKLKIEQKPVGIIYKANDNSISSDSRLKSIKCTTRDDNTLMQHQFFDVTG